MRSSPESDERRNENAVTRYRHGVRLGQAWLRSLAQGAAYFFTRELMCASKSRCAASSFLRASCQGR